MFELDPCLNFGINSTETSESFKIDYPLLKQAKIL